MITTWLPLPEKMLLVTAWKNPSEAHVSLRSVYAKRFYQRKRQVFRSSNDLLGYCKTTKSDSGRACGKRHGLFPFAQHFCEHCQVRSLTCNATPCRLAAHNSFTCVDFIPSLAIEGEVAEVVPQGRYPDFMLK